jgi:hypothetical protein
MLSLRVDPRARVIYLGRMGRCSTPRLTLVSQ